MSKSLKVVSVIIVLVSGFVFLTSQSETIDWERFHTEEELTYIRAGGGNLPSISNDLFTGAGRCEGCHGMDFTGTASTTEDGMDVNVVDDWRSTMMANSAKDPFWRAKVSHEITINPAHSLDLQTKCTSCHAPMGHFNAIHTGEEYYSMENLLADQIGLDGVSCNACHQQKPEGLASRHSGDLEFVEDTLFGPYGDEGDEPLFGAPMTAFVGYEPVYGDYIDKSEMCAGCHTLLTNTADLDGNLTGNKFVEQATYHEWLNSDFADPLMGEECQGCHFPRIQDSVILSANYPFLERRSPYGLHYMVGANTFMLEMFRDNVTDLGLNASPDQFQKTIDRTMDMLRNQSIELEVDYLESDMDSAFFEVKLENKAGHKFPSGYPSRRAFIEFTLTDENGGTLFASGVPQADFEVQGQNPTYEPHYTVIRDPEEVQIYELVMGDVNGDVTTVLERADFAIKDNRLTPKGFTTSHAVYDTTLIAGNALMDVDFNYDENGVEGSGTDLIRYHVPLNDYTGDVTVSCKIYYQTAPPKWMEEMFAEDTPEINLFKGLYEETGADPVLIAEETFDVFVTDIEGLDSDNGNDLLIYPNPANDGYVNVRAKTGSIELINVYNSAGQEVKQLLVSNAKTVRLDLPEAAGNYIVRVKTTKGVFKEKIVVGV